jgi:hypothetical protein
MFLIIPQLVSLSLNDVTIYYSCSIYHPVPTSNADTRSHRVPFLITRIRDIFEVEVDLSIEQQLPAL